VLSRPTPTAADRWLPLVRRVVLGIVAAPFLMAIGMTLIDSYRRRGKRRSVSFPTAPPSTVPVGDGEVTTYTFGSDLFDAMLAAIDGAQRQILLETYIWKGDEVGQRFKTAVEAAAARGVEVFVIYDAFANLVVSPRFKHFPASVRVLRYPVYAAGWRPFDLRRYGRDHRKILVVDDSVGFVGGYNIGSDYATEWRDTHVRITGPGVWDLKRAFADFWNLNRRRRLRASERPLLLETASTWEPTIRFHRNVPRLWMFPIRSMYIEAITRASRNVWMTTAYFLPDQDFADALTSAARRGVDVRLLIPAKSNHVVADWISRGYFSQLLEAGVKVLRYRDAMVHAKTATIDGTWTTVGTANIDRLSLTGNYEINVEIIDPKLAGALEEVFRVDESNCLELSKAEWEARDVYRRFTEFVLNPLRPLL
jgi:cardiolipin synthase A/B